MSKCGKCGANLPESAKFCKACGRTASFDDKKARVMKQEKSWVKPAVLAAVAVIVLVGGWMFKDSTASNRMGEQASVSPSREASARLANAVAVTARGGEVRVPLDSDDDGNAHFYAYASGGKTITFFVMKAADGSIRTAFDACMACNHAKLGYRQQGKKVVCNNCGMAFSPSDIGGKTGGCNPIPVEKTLDGRTVVLKARDIEAGAKYF